MLGCFWFLGLGVEGLDGVDGDEWHREEFADTRDIAGAGLAREKAVVADAVEALRQHVNQEAADELVAISSANRLENRRDAMPSLSRA